MISRVLVDQFVHASQALALALQGVRDQARRQGLDQETAATVQFLGGQVREITMLSEEIQGRLRASRQAIEGLLRHLAESERQVAQQLGEPLRMLREVVDVAYGRNPE